MDSIELAVHVQSTNAFINADPSLITLTPHSQKIPDGAGGFKNVKGTPREPQTVRLIPQSDKVPEVHNSEGILAKPEFVVMGLPDLAMERYDRFTAFGRIYEIAQVHDKPAYEKKGDAVRV